MADIQDNSISEDAALLGEDSVDNTSTREISQDESDNESESEEEESQPDDDSEEEEEEESEEDEEKPRDLAPHERPSIKDVTTKFPELFKTFPSLRDMYFREKEFSSIFDTLDVARTASENSEAFENLRSDIFTGNGEKLINSIKDTDPAKLDSFAENFMSSLAKVSPDAHWKAAVPLLENAVRSLYNESKKFGDTDQGNNYKFAAQYFAQFLFGDIKVASGETRVSKTKEAPNPREEELNKREKDMDERVYTEFAAATTRTGQKGLKDLIMDKDKSGNLKIDPDAVMTDFIKNTLAEKIQIEVDRQLSADSEHMRYMGTLWSRSKKEGYSPDSKAKIVSAYLARARQVVPSVRAKLVSEALGTTTKHNANKQTRTDVVKTRREPGSGGRGSSSSSKMIDPKRIDFGRTTDMDILNDNVTTKG